MSAPFSSNLRHIRLRSRLLVGFGRCAAAVPSLDECLADPTRGVHSLYSIVQELAAKLAAKPESQSGAALPSAPIDVVRALERENTRLKLENSNMYFMKNQNEKLAQQLAQISDERCGARVHCRCVRG